MTNPSRLSRLLLGLLLCHFTSASAQSPSEPGEIRGRIVDAESGEPVVSVDVDLVGTPLQTQTDRSGSFEFPELAPGPYTVRASRLGYESLEESSRVNEGVVLDLQLAMKRAPVPLEEITVTPGSFAFMESSSSRQTMSREELESVPQLAEDVFRAVNRLPGLASGDYAAHFSIRGGRSDETLILLDGLELYEPFHLKDFDEGAISIIDTQTIEGVQLMTGGFPVKYGNRRSGIFSIDSRRPRLDHARFNLGLSFINARAMALGPLGDGSGSWIVSGRSGYMDLVFNLINQDELPSPRYHDLFGKIEYDLSPNHNLSFDMMHAGDKYTFNASSTTGFQDSLDSVEDAENKYGNSYAWATLTSAFGERTMARNMISAGLVKRSRKGSERVVGAIEPIYSLRNEREFTILSAWSDWTTKITDSFVLGYGADVRRLSSTDEFINVVGQDPNDPTPDPDGNYPVTTVTSHDETGTLTGAYLSGRLRVASPLVFEVGVRYDDATYTGDSDFSPRVSAVLGLGKNRTLRAGWGRYRQIQGIDDVSALDEGEKYFPSELTEQWTAGIEQVLGNGALLRIEGYYKKGTELRPDYRNWKSGIDTFPETNEDRILVFPLENEAKGIEVYYDQTLSNRSAIRLSGAYSIAEETVERMDNVNGFDELEFDRVHPIPQDQRFAANVDYTYRLGHAWTLSGAFSFHTGWPTTLEELVPVTNENGDEDFTVKPQKIYGERLPEYLRLDVRATRRWSTDRGDWSFFVELVNLTNHANVFGYDYFKSLDSNGDFILERDEETWFTILPSIGATWGAKF